MAGPEPLGCAGVVLAGFLRLVTNPAIFDPPSPMREALGFCEALTAQPRVVMIPPGRRHWELFARYCGPIRGALVSDAFVAALAVEHGCELITTDADFARFPGLRWRHPFAEGGGYRR